MIILQNVTINGLPLNENTAVELDLTDELIIRPGLHPSIADRTINITPQAEDKYTLRGLVTAVRYAYDKMPETGYGEIDIKGTNVYEPWISYSIKGYINEYSMGKIHVGLPLGIEKLVIRVTELDGKIDQEKLPKVKLELTEKDAAYLQALVIADPKSDTKLAQYIRKQTKAVE